MKNSELIEKLKQLPADMEVIMQVSDVLDDVCLTGHVEVIDQCEVLGEKQIILMELL